MPRSVRISFLWNRLWRSFFFVDNSQRRLKNQPAKWICELPVQIMRAGLLHEGFNAVCECPEMDVVLDVRECDQRNGGSFYSGLTRFGVSECRRCYWMQMSP